MENGFLTSRRKTFLKKKMLRVEYLLRSHVLCFQMSGTSGWDVLTWASK